MTYFWAICFSHHNICLEHLAIIPFGGALGHLTEQEEGKSVQNSGALYQVSVSGKLSHAHLDRQTHPLFKRNGVG